jgi:hypothetical protein
MDDAWRNASTTAIKFYEYETSDGVAIIFRHRNGQRGYLACLIHAGHFLMADAYFVTIDAAKLWVAYHIVRLMLRHQPLACISASRTAA